MTDNESDYFSSAPILDNDIVSEWAQKLAQTPFVQISDEGDLQLGLIVGLDRTIETEHLDQVTLVAGDELPSIISIGIFDGKRKLKIGLDSNHIPQKVDLLREKFHSYWEIIRSISFWILIITSITYFVEVSLGVQFPDILTPIRIVLFWAGLVFYVLSDRIVLEGVARANNASMLGCLNCGNIQIRQELVSDNPNIDCFNCGGTMITLVRAGLGRLEFRNPHFEHMLESELKSVIEMETNEDPTDELGIDRAKQDIDQLYEEESIIALYCLALEVGDDIGWSDEDEDIIGDPGNIRVHATWGARGEEGSDEQQIANSLKDALLARAIILRAHEKDGIDVDKQMSILSDIIERMD